MAYHILLDNFEGPMDLLLHLISQARIEIRDVFVSPIIDQYLGFMDQMTVEQMERTSEFVAMAARLLEIKSRWLLPKDPSATDEESLEGDLIRQLELYRQYVQASDLLKARKEQADRIYYRLPEESYLQQRIEPNNLTLENLIGAFERLKIRLDEAASPPREDQIHRDLYTVREKVLFITRRLRQKGSVGFLSFFSSRSSREEVIVTFLALLEMVKNDLIVVEQAAADKDMIISQRKEQTFHAVEPSAEDGSH